MGRVGWLGAVACAAWVAAAQGPATGQPLAPWTPGTLEIHQLSTGRGNAAFFIFPDGTTMLFDAGAAEKPEETAAFIARYARQAAARDNLHVDYGVLSHYHVDHMGALVDVMARLPILTMIDCGADFLPPPDADAGYRFYRAAFRAQAIRVGRADQIVLLKDRAAFPTFEVRNVAANGDVWVPGTDRSEHVFPPLASLAKEDQPSENMCSIALRIRYGAFDFYTGGDLPGVPDAGAPEWQSVETPVAKAIGAADVQVVNHHGSIDPASAFFLATLRSRVLILPSWSTTHPSQDALKRMMTARLYPGPRDIFATTMHPETKASIGARADQLAADHGHIVVRVAPGGATYEVFVLDNRDAATPAVLSTHGPYRSQ